MASRGITLGRRPGGRAGRARSGQGLVEFALVALVAFLPMIFGLMELGRGVWYYNQLSQLSREGARWLVVLDTNDKVSGTSRFFAPGNSPDGDETYTVGACAACADDTAVGWIRSLATGIPREQLTLRVRRAGSASASEDVWSNATTWTNEYMVHGRPLYVEVSYPYQPIVTSLLNIPATITLRASTVMKME